MEMKTYKHTPTVTWITMVAVLVSMCASFSFGRRASAQSSEENQSTAQRETHGATDSQYPALSKYATDLTLLAHRGKLEPARGYEANVARVIASLSATAKAPVVVGESDLDRDAIARGVASRIAFGDVPETLRNKRVFRLSLDALAKGANGATIKARPLSRDHRADLTQTVHGQALRQIRYLKRIDARSVAYANLTRYSPRE